jgi:hypothetical protein
MSDTHFGPITVHCDHDARRATLTIRRHLQPLSPMVIERLHTWALEVTTVSYPGYEILDLCAMTHKKEKA